MGAVLGLHDSVVHVVEGGGLGMVNALVLVVSHAPLVWTADVINSMFVCVIVIGLMKIMRCLGSLNLSPPSIHTSPLVLMFQQHYH